MIALVGGVALIGDYDRERALIQDGARPRRSGLGVLEEFDSRLTDNPGTPHRLAHFGAVQHRFRLLEAVESMQYQYVVGISGILIDALFQDTVFFCSGSKESYSLRQAS